MSVFYDPEHFAALWCESSNLSISPSRDNAFTVLHEINTIALAEVVYSPWHKLNP